MAPQNMDPESVALRKQIADAKLVLVELNRFLTVAEMPRDDRRHLRSLLVDLRLALTSQS